MSEEIQVKPALNLNFNIPTLLAIGGLFATVVTGWSKMDARITAIETSRAARMVQNDAAFAGINARLSDLQTIPYRVTQAEAHLDETNKRLDRLQESVLNALDGLRKDVAQLDKRIDVLDAKLDQIVTKFRPTSLDAASR